MKSLLILTTVFFTGCSLAASLTGGTRTENFTPGDEYLGQTHSMTINFVMTNEVVTALTIESGAASDLERAHQTAFAANVRSLIIEKSVEEIDIPVGIGDEERLRKVFRKVIDELIVKSEK